MKPPLRAVLQAAAAEGGTAFLGIVLHLGLDDYEHGVARRKAEADALETLVERGLSIAPGGLSASLQRALAEASGHDGLAMTTVDARLDTLRNAVIELQTWLEETDDERAADLLRDVWRVEREALEQRARMAPNW